MLFPFSFLGAAIGGGGGSTFNPSDQSTGITLSNGNLTATGTTGPDPLVRGTTSKTTGKLYFEVFFHNRNDGQVQIGLANSTEDLNTYLGHDFNGVGMVLSSGQVYINGGSSLTAPALTTNDLYCGIAVDFGANRMWFRETSAPTVWNAGGTADPATGLGGQDISGITGPFFICLNGGTAGVGTLNVGGTSFNATAPSGYSAWG